MIRPFTCYVEFLPVGYRLNHILAETTEEAKEKAVAQFNAALAKNEALAVREASLDIHIDPPIEERSSTPGFHQQGDQDLPAYPLAGCDRKEWGWILAAEVPTVPDGTPGPERLARLFPMAH
jgi:hypothetical protein